MKKAILIFFFVLALSVTAHSSVAPDFTLKSLDGKRYTLSALKGKVVILNFWASWCGACIEEMPSLDGFYRQYRKRGVEVLGITSDRDEELVKRFLKKHPVSYPILLDKRGDVFVDKYVVSLLPMTFIIDREGNVVEKLIGTQDFQSKDFKEKIEKLLGGAK